MFNPKNYKKVIPFLLIIAVAAIFLFIGGGSEENVQNNLSKLEIEDIDPSQVPEIIKIKSSSSTSERSEALKNLMSRVGPVYAQEIFRKAGLPFTGETHFIAHAAGDYLYENYGLDGLQFCRDYFLSACYHDFIISAMADHGIEGIAEAMDQCEERGSGTLTQCAHAAGHGFVAWKDYDLLAALRMCDKTQDEYFNLPVYNCYDGAFMENLWSSHDGKPSPKRWIKEDDIYYPCNDERIPEKYLRGCWSNQASVMYQIFDGDLERVAEGCYEIKNETYKRLCFNNFARQIHPLTEEDTDKAFEMCSKATTSGWEYYCLETLVTSSWTVGNRSGMPFDICERIEGENKKTCFDRLIYLISGERHEEARSLCRKIKDVEFKEVCLERVK